LIGGGGMEWFRDQRFDGGDVVMVEGQQQVGQ
jgi:hypothetical protein